MIPLPSADLRNSPRRDTRLSNSLTAVPVSAAPVAAEAGFDRGAVEAVGGDWEEAARLNAVLAGLAAQRQGSVARDGAQRGRVAWKLAVFRQAALHQLVALAQGSAANWNARQVQAAALCARALLEAVAELQGAAAQLQRLGEAGDLAALDALLMARSFALPLDGPVGAAAFDPARLEAGAARADYDALSGLCGPAALGQYRVFGELDKAGTAVTFAPGAGFERGVLGHVLGGVAVLAPAEAALRGLAELQGRLAALEAPAA